MDNYQITSYSGAEIEALLVKIDELNGATPEAAGLMSAADKAKLDGVNSGAEVNRINRIMLGETEIAPTEKVVTLPLDSAPVLNGTKLLLSGAVYQALTNYYTKAQVDALISGIKQFSAVVVATLPESGEQFTLYLVGPTGTGADKYEEYIWNNDAWLKIGDTSIDLSGYATKEELSQLGQKLEHVEVVDDSSSDEVIEFQDDDGTFIASVSEEDGVKSKEFVLKDENGENPINLYTEEKDDDRLAFGDANGHDIVLFSGGEILTKNFDSRVIAPALMDIAQLKRQNSGDSASERKNEFLPDFYSYKKGKSGGWFDRLRLMHFSDTHNNSTNLAEALSLSQGLVDAVIDTGDNANGIASTVASSTIAELQNYVNVGRNNNPTPMPLLICNGNHDVPNLTKKQYYDIMCDYMSKTTPGFVFGDSENYRSYGYYDITPNSTIGTVRIITLDPFDYADGQFMNPYGTTGAGGWMNCVFSQTQINWLIATLRDAVSNGFKVMTAMHYSFGDNTVFTPSGSANPDANYHQDPFMIPDIIDAMQNKTTLSKSYPDDENINNIIINEDFSGINDLHYICHLFGHIHSENEYQCQKTDGSKFYNILMVGAPNMGSEGLAINKVPLQPGTTNSIKLTVLEIDTVEKAIYRVNYGAYKAFDMSITERTKKIPYTFNK